MNFCADAVVARTPQNSELSSVEGDVVPQTVGGASATAGRAEPNTHSSSNEASVVVRGRAAPHPPAPSGVNAAYFARRGASSGKPGLGSNAYLYSYISRTRHSPR